MEKGSNLRHAGLESAALPAELSMRVRAFDPFDPFDRLRDLRDLRDRS